MTYTNLKFGNVLDGWIYGKHHKQSVNVIEFKNAVTSLMSERKKYVKNLRDVWRCDSTPETITDSLTDRGNCKFYNITIIILM